MKAEGWDRLSEDFSSKVLQIAEIDLTHSISKTLKKLGGKSKIAADLGCGIGSSTRLLAPHFKSVTGFDFSNPLLESARNKTSAKNVNYKYLNFGCSAPIKKNFDVCLSVNAFISNDHFARKLGEKNIVAMTKPKGYVVVVVPSFESIMRTYQILKDCQIDQINSDAKADQFVNSIAANEIVSFSSGIVKVGDVPTKHYLQDELLDTFSVLGLKNLECHRVSFPWHEILENLPARFSATPPWDWMMIGRKP